MKAAILAGLLAYAILNTPVSKTQVSDPVVIREVEGFSESWLEKKLISLNVKHYKVAIAQAKLVTGNFKGKIFLENNNLFGMKRAKQRATTSTKTLNGHAYYNSIEDCVLDYAMYYSKYLSNMESEDEVIWYLSRSYAEDDQYYKKIKRMIK